jgi:hypothetical protein
MMPMVEVKPSSIARRPTTRRVLRIPYAAADHRIDVDVKLGVLGQQAQLAVQHLQALLRNVVRHHVVDGDLQMLEAGAVEALDALGGEQIAVGDETGDHAVAADARDDQVQLGMQQRLAAADGDDTGSQLGQLVEPLVHGLDRYRLGMIVVLVAVGAGKIAAPHGNDVRHHGMASRGQPSGDHADFPRAQGARVSRPFEDVFPCPSLSAKLFLLQHSFGRARFSLSTPACGRRCSRHRVAQHADAFDFDFHHIAGREPARSARRSGVDRHRRALVSPSH